MALVKKISAKTIVGDVKRLCKDIDNAVVINLANFYGRASGFKTGSSDFGNWTAFTGSFEAVNLQTGEEFQARQMFLVEPLQGMLLDQLANSESVDFACTLAVVVNDKLPTGYEYRVTPITEIKRSDELESLRNMAGLPSLKLLAAPVTNDVAEGVTTDKPKKK